MGPRYQADVPDMLTEGKYILVFDCSKNPVYHITISLAFSGVLGTFHNRGKVKTYPKKQTDYMLDVMRKQEREDRILMKCILLYS